MTSIDMLGASVSVMKLDEQLKKLLSCRSDAPAFKVDGPAGPVHYVDFSAEDEEAREASCEVETDEAYAVVQKDKISLHNFIYIVDKMSECIIKNEVAFCELDSYAGDGDFGMSVAKGFRQLKREWKEIIENKAQTIGSFLDACSLVIMEYCGGASGPVWGSAFRSAGKYTGDKKELSMEEFKNMMQMAVKGIQKTGERSFGRGAVVGDKTLIDALVPCAESWGESVKSGVDVKTAFINGAKAAVAGAEATEKIVARMGRAGTAGERSLGYPDAGAYALGVIFTEISQSIRIG